MSFEYPFAYEDRGSIHTSRWLLDGVNTKAAGNTTAGRVWLLCSRDGDTVTADLYKDPDCDSAEKVASGSADISAIDSAAARCELSEQNDSGLSGQFHFESYTADPGYAVEVLVSLCTDADLADEFSNLSDLPVYGSSVGLARYCAVATRKVLLLVSQMYAEELGGFGAPEHLYHTVSLRETPDFRRLANPDQLKDAAVHWALMVAFGACHERAEQTMYSHWRDYHDSKRKEAVAAWNLTFNTDPDSDEDADTQKSSGTVRITRL